MNKQGMIRRKCRTCGRRTQHDSIGRGVACRECGERVVETEHGPVVYRPEVAGPQRCMGKQRAPADVREQTERGFLTCALNRGHRGYHRWQVKPKAETAA